MKKRGRDNSPLLFIHKMKEYTKIYIMTGKSKKFLPLFPVCWCYIDFMKFRSIMRGIHET
ncbi:TPA: hypothetical protein DCG86_04745 [Candidatus Marinimicrobia bacterium]|nr:hypothetical protein [Candidatus Neomarinimicrobiota bacterium]HBY18393.1 hypothetical protein [Candidatus Neomarinimicrobiota bacterium]